MDYQHGIARLLQHHDGWTYESIADRVGASVHTVGKWARGERSAPKNKKVREALESLIANLPPAGESDDDVERRRLLRKIGAYAEDLPLDRLAVVAATLRREAALAAAREYPDEVMEALGLAGAGRVTQSA